MVGGLRREETTSFVLRDFFLFHHAIPRARNSFGADDAFGHCKQHEATSACPRFGSMLACKTEGRDQNRTRHPIFPRRSLLIGGLFLVEAMKNSRHAFMVVRDGGTYRHLSLKSRRIGFCVSCY